MLIPTPALIGAVSPGRGLVEFPANRGSAPVSAFVSFSVFGPSSFSGSTGTGSARRQLLLLSDIVVDVC